MIYDHFLHVAIYGSRRLLSCSREGLPDLETGDLRRNGEIGCARPNFCAELGPLVVKLAIPADALAAAKNNGVTTDQAARAY